MRRYVACFGVELRKAANRRLCAGMHYVDGMMLLCDSNSLVFMHGGKENEIRDVRAEL